MRYFLILLCLALVTSCKKPVHQNNEITKVELASSGSWRGHGTVISIDSALNYKYYGLPGDSSGHGKRKYYTGKISEEFWDTLNNRLNQLKYKTIDTLENGPIIEDAHMFQLVIHWGKHEEMITRIDTGGNYPMIKTLNWLNNSFKRVKLQQVDTIFKFETYCQDPPQPALERIKFPPPQKEYSAK